MISFQQWPDPSAIPLWVSGCFQYMHEPFIVAVRRNEQPCKDSPKSTGGVLLCLHLTQYQELLFRNLNPHSLAGAESIVGDSPQCLQLAALTSPGIYSTCLALTLLQAVLALASESSSRGLKYRLPCPCQRDLQCSWRSRTFPRWPRWLRGRDLAGFRETLYGEKQFHCHSLVRLLGSRLLHDPCFLEGASA